MKKNVKILLVAGVLLLVGYEAVAQYQAYLNRLEYNHYGAAPAMGFAFHERAPDGSYCVRITHVTPETHHDWRGNLWQDAELRWEQVDWRYPRLDRPVAPDYTGVVEAGTIICGLLNGEPWELRKASSGSLMTSWTPTRT